MLLNEWYIWSDIGKQNQSIHPNFANIPFKIIEIKRSTDYIEYFENYIYSNKTNCSARSYIINKDIVKVPKILQRFLNV